MNQTYYEGAGMVKMVSRFLAVILAAVMIFSAGACSQQTVPAADVAAFKDPETVVYSERFGYFPVNQIAVVFYDDLNSKKAAGILKQIGGKVVGGLGIINLYQIETNFTTEAELNAAMEAARVLDALYGANERLGKLRRALYNLPQDKRVRHDILVAIRALIETITSLQDALDGRIES